MLVPISEKTEKSVDFGTDDDGVKSIGPCRMYFSENKIKKAMARLLSPFEYTGKIGDVVAYRMRGVEGIVLRRKGGATRAKIEKDPRFANTRLVNAEFGARSKVAGRIAAALRPISSVADYPFLGALNALVKTVQDADTVKPLGKRSVSLSKLPSVLDGFPLNQKSCVEQVVFPSPAVSLSRENLSATISLPALFPGVNLFVPPKFSWFRVEVSIGVVPDFHKRSKHYEPSHPAYVNAGSVVSQSAWFAATERISPFTVNTRLAFNPPDENFVMVVGLAIRYGEMTRNGVIAIQKDQEDYGVGKILQVG